MRLEINELGQSKPVALEPWRLPFQATVAVEVPEGTKAAWGLVWTADGKLWFEDADLPAGQSQSGWACFSDPIKAVALVVTELDGEPLVLTTLQAGDKA